MPGKANPYRIIAQIIIFSAFIALGALILFPLQRALQGGMANLRDNFITLLEYRIDRRIEYSSISPALFGSFDVRNVRIVGSDNDPVLTMSRFRIAYSLLDLLQGRIQAIHAVRIDSPNIDFDMSRDQDLIHFFTSLNKREKDSPQDSTFVFPEKLMIRIRNGTCLVFDGRDQFALDSLAMTFEIAGSRIVLDGRWNAGVTIDNFVGTPIKLNSEMRVTGSCRTDMEEGEAVLSIPTVTGDVLSASPIAFGFVLEDHIIHMGKMPGDHLIELSAEYRLNDGMLDARFECSDFRLSEFLSFSGGLESVRPFQDIAGSGTASFTRRHDGSLDYAVNLDGSAPDTVRPYTAAETSFAISITGDERYARIDNLHFSVPADENKEDEGFGGDIGFTGSAGLSPFAPNGVLSLANFRLPGRDSLNADITIHTHQHDSDREIDILCGTLSLGQVDLSAFIAALHLSEGGLRFTVSALRLPDAAAAGGQTGLLAVEGRIDSPERFMETRIGLNSLSAGDLAGMLRPFLKQSVPVPLAMLLDNTVITTEVVLATDFSTVSYNAPNIALTGRSDDFSGNVALSGTEANLELREGRFRWGDESLTLDGQAAFADLKDISFAVNSGYRDRLYYIEGLLDGKSVNIRGPCGLDVHIEESGGRYAGYMKADGFPLPFLQYPAACTFLARVSYDNRASWSMNLEQLELTDIAGPAGTAYIRVSGRADQAGASFPLLHYRDAIGPLNGKADISWAEDFSGFSGTAEMGEGKEQYRIKGTLSGRRLGLDFSGLSMRIDRAFGGTKALANGNLSISWVSSDSFRAELNLSSLTGMLYGQGFGAKAHAILDNERLVVNGFNFSYAGIEGTIPRFTVNGRQGKAEAIAEVIGAAGGKSLEGRLRLAAAFMPVRSLLETREISNLFNGTLHVEGLRYGAGEQAQAFDIIFARSNGTFSLSGGPRSMIRFQMDNAGNFYGGLSSPFPVRGTIIGNIHQKAINASCDDIYVDLAELFNLLPENPDITLTGGYVNASIAIKGSVSDPDFFGSARATSLRIKIPQFVTQELRPIPFTVAIEGNEIRFGPVSTSVGSGAGSITGLFYFDRWIPNTFSIDIAVPRETPIPYGFNITGFTASGDASGSLNISMENLMFDISGDLYANNSNLGIDHNELTSPGGESVFAQSQIPFVVNLSVSTGPVVEFFYPSSRFPILRAMPDMGTKIYVTADSLARQYSLSSDIRIRSGEIFYFERSFYIRSGTLALHENELRFDPRLTARAEVRDRTDDGPVTISMIVENAPLLTFNARFESAPPLSQMEILGLLGQNIAGTQFSEDTNSVQRAFLSSTSDLLAQFVLVRQMEQQIRNFMRLDMFSVRTQAIQNALFMATGIMPSSVDRNAGVGNYFDNTTVFGGKYIGQDMFIQGMLSMRYDANKPSFGGLTFAPDIGLELQNPLFSIRWDFVPTHPENWYANDNSITLTWNRTF